MGETRRKLEVRVKEYRADTDNTVKDRAFTRRKGNNQKLRKTSLPSWIMCA